jgi:Mg-chelatase subunit ChlD
MKKTRKKTTRTKNKKKTYIAIVLDRSGSMSSIHKETVDGINKQLKTIRENGAAGGDTRVSLIQFDGEIETVFKNQTPAELKEWAYSEFRPRGSTAMFDGIWNAINHLKEQEETDDTGFLVCVISDGEENASKEISQQVLSDEIKKLQDTGKWTFTYMLANTDINKVRRQFQSSAANISSFDATSVGSANAYYSNATSTANYLVGTRSLGLTNSTNFYDSSTNPVTEEPAMKIDGDLVITGRIIQANPLNK